MANANQCGSMVNELANLNGTWDRFDSRNIYDVQFLMFNKYFAIPLIRNIYVRIVFFYLDFEPYDLNNYLYNTIFFTYNIFFNFTFYIIKLSLSEWERCSPIVRLTREVKKLEMRRSIFSASYFGVRVRTFMLTVKKRTCIRLNCAYSFCVLVMRVEPGSTVLV